jgi:hypothetical protein
LTVKVIWLFLHERVGIQRCLDSLMAVIILCFLAALMIVSYMPLKKRAVVLHNALYGLEKYKRDLALHWAIEGAWPSDEGDILRIGPDPSVGRGKGLAESAVYESGAIHILTGGEHPVQALTCRPVVLSENPTGPVGWVCGPKLLLDWRWIVRGEDKTTVDASVIPDSLR